MKKPIYSVACLLTFTLVPNLSHAQAIKKASETDFRMALKCVDLGGTVRGNSRFLESLKLWEAPVNDNGVTYKFSTESSDYKSWKALAEKSYSSKYQTLNLSHFYIQDEYETDGSLELGGRGGFHIAKNSKPTGRAVLTRFMPPSLSHQLSCMTQDWPANARPACVLSKSTYSQSKCDSVKTAESWHNVEVVSNPTAALPGSFCKVSPGNVAKIGGASSFDWFNLMDSEPKKYTESAAHKSHESCINSSARNATADWCFMQLKNQVGSELHLLELRISNNISAIENLLGDLDAESRKKYPYDRAESWDRITDEMKGTEKKLGELKSNLESRYPDSETASVCSKIINDSTLQNIQANLQTEKSKWKSKLPELEQKQSVLKKEVSKIPTRPAK